MCNEPPAEESKIISGFCPLLEDYAQIICVSTFRRSGKDVVEKVRHCGCSHSECLLAFSKECALFMSLD